MLFVHFHKEFSLDFIALAAWSWWFVSCFLARFLEKTIKTRRVFVYGIVDRSWWLFGQHTEAPRCFQWPFPVGRPYLGWFFPSLKTTLTFCNQGFILVLIFPSEKTLVKIADLPKEKSQGMAFTSRAGELYLAAQRKGRAGGAGLEKRLFFFKEELGVLAEDFFFWLEKPLGFTGRRIIFQGADFSFGLWRRSSWVLSL